MMNHFHRLLSLLFSLWSMHIISLLHTFWRRLKEANIHCNQYHDHVNYVMLLISSLLFDFRKFLFSPSKQHKIIDKSKFLLPGIEIEDSELHESPLLDSSKPIRFEGNSFSGNSPLCPLKLLSLFLRNIYYSCDTWRPLTSQYLGFGCNIFIWPDVCNSYVCWMQNGRKSHVYFRTLKNLPPMSHE